MTNAYLVGDTAFLLPFFDMWRYFPIDVVPDKSLKLSVTFIIIRMGGICVPRGVGKGDIGRHFNAQLASIFWWLV